MKRVHCASLAVMLSVILVPVICSAETSSVSTRSKLLTHTISFESPVLFNRAGVDFTYKEFDAHLNAQVPIEDQQEFLSSPDRVSRLFDFMYLSNYHLKASESLEFLSTSDFQARLYNIVASAVRDRAIEERLNDLMLGDYTAPAREIYLNEPSLFVQPSTIDFYHLLIPVSNSDQELAAISLVQQASDLLTEARELPALQESGWELLRESPESLQLFEGVEIDSLLPELREPAQIVNPGVPVGPVRSTYGWHFLQLVTRHNSRPLTWEQASERAKNIAASRHREDLTQRITQELLDEPIHIVDDGVRRLLQQYGVSWSEDAIGVMN